MRAEALRRTLRLVAGDLHRLLDQRPVGPRPVGTLAEHLAEAAATGLAVVQAEQVAGDVLERQPCLQLRFDIGAHLLQQLLAAAQRRAGLRRFEQVKISSYRAGDNVPLPDGRVGRNAEVRVINNNTQSERTVRVREIWRWDAEGKRWLQANGLPDLWQER